MNKLSLTAPRSYDAAAFSDSFRKIEQFANCFLIGSKTYDPGNLVDAAGATTTVNVPGAVLGDFAIPSFGKDLQGITLTAYVSAVDTASVRFQNESGGAIDLDSSTLSVLVIRK